MRELTQKEIDNAPSWATHYDAVGESIMFESKGSTQMMIKGELGNFIPFGPVSEHSIPIPHKEFDISEYEFSDCDIQSVMVDGCEGHEYIHISFKEETIELTQSRFDVIAMAKALKLTADELK